MKITTKIIGLSLLSILLIGCQNTSTPKEAENVNLTFNIWDSDQAPGMRAMADAYTEKHPNISIDVEVIPWDQYWSSLESAAQGESLPDIFWMHSNEISKYAKGDVLYDLTDLVNDSEITGRDHFPEGLIELYTHDNQLYGIPKDYSSIGLWYNRELFDKAGPDYPNETWNWNDVLNAAQNITDHESGIYGFLAANNREEGYHNIIYQEGGYVISEDKDKSGFRLQETIDAVQWWVDLSIKHRVSPTQTQFAENERISYFQAGRAGMAMFGSWMTNAMLNNEYTLANADVARLPNNGNSATIYNGLAYSVSKFTNHPEEALGFIEFLGSEEANIIQGEMGSAIPAYIGTDYTFFEAFPEFNTEAFTLDMNNAVLKPYSTYTQRWEYVENHTLMKVFLGEDTVEGVSKQIVEQVEQILESERIQDKEE